MEQFKRAKVIMLPTENNSNIFLKNNNKLEYNNDRPYYGITNLNWKYQHLYIISDDEIKEGDYFINIIQKIIYKHNVKNYEVNKTYLKKIITTTDKSLTISINNKFETFAENYNSTLPQPSQQFIEKYIEEYNKGNIITDVLVEYEIIPKPVHDYPLNVIKQLKVNPKDNTITIKKLKDNFNLNEIEKALFNTKLLTINEFNDIWKVMKKNLG